MKDRAFLLIVCLITLLSCRTRKTAGELLENAKLETGNRAIHYYSRAILRDGNNVEAWWRRGDEYYQMGAFRKAIQDFDKAISIDSSFNSGYLFGDKGNAEQAIGNYTAALKDYTLALAFCDPVSAEYPTTPRENFHFYRAQTWLALNDTTLAMKDLDSAIYYWNRFPRAIWLRAKIKVAKGNYIEALNDYNMLPVNYGNTADFPDCAEDFYFCGLAKFKTGDTTFCSYWKVAAEYHYPKAIKDISEYCK